MQRETLERLQRRAMRIILNLPWTHPIDDDYATLNLTSLNLRRNFALACFSYKLYNDLLPRKLVKYRPAIFTNVYNTRNQVLYAPYVTHPCLRHLDRSPFLLGLEILNNISYELLSAPDVFTFKSLLRDSQFYVQIAALSC